MNVVVTQPLHYPAPVIAYGDKPTLCYTNPKFIGESTDAAYDGLDVVPYEDVRYCGKMAKYQACAGATVLTVVYPEEATPHNFIQYGKGCYTFTGSVTYVGGGPGQVLTPADTVVPVASCTDPACIAAASAGAPNPVGATMVYFTVADSGSQAVGVLFEHLDTGTAHYGLCPMLVDDGLRGLGSGNTQLHFLSAPRLLVMQSQGTGTLTFKVQGAHFRKRLILVRGGVEVVSKAMDPVATKVRLEVKHLDEVYLDAAAPTGRLATFATGARVWVRWEPSVTLPRLYDTGTLYKTAVIEAVGFCGLVPHQTYTFFGTLPADAATSGLVNPDSLVTVQSAGTERLLVRSRAEGDQVPTNMGLPWYAGQRLDSPIVFKFYAVREIQGGHGEMDVWLDVEGTFPGTLSLDPYRVITRKANSYRRDAEPGDLRRGHLEVEQSTVKFFLPNQYHGPDGRLLTFHGTAATLVHDGVTYTKSGSDPGLSFDILGSA